MNVRQRRTLRRCLRALVPRKRPYRGDAWPTKRPHYYKSLAEWSRLMDEGKVIRCKYCNHWFEREGDETYCLKPDCQDEMAAKLSASAAVAEAVVDVTKMAKAEQAMLISADNSLDETAEVDESGEGEA